MTDPVFRKKLARFERAVRADENKGAQHPEDQPRIERELNAARKALIEDVEGTPK